MPYITIELANIGKPRIVIPAPVIRALTARYKSFTLYFHGYRLNKLRRDRRMEIPSEARARFRMEAHVPYKLYIRKGPGLVRFRRWGRIKYKRPYPDYYHKGFIRSLEFTKEQGYYLDYCWGKIKTFIRSSWRQQRGISTRLAYVKIFFQAIHSKEGLIMDTITSGTYILSTKREVEILIREMRGKWNDLIKQLVRGVDAGYVEDFWCWYVRYISFSEYRKGKRQKGWP